MLKTLIFTLAALVVVLMSQSVNAQLIGESDTL